MHDTPAASDVLSDGLSLLGEALYGYLQEIENDVSVCEAHNKTAAVHDRGTALQVYRLFKVEENTARQLRQSTEVLRGWEESDLWVQDSEVSRGWEKLQNEVERRMADHAKLHPIVTRGVEWEGLPLLIHAYKFEPDPVMKVELILPPFECSLPELSVTTMARILGCHEFLIPSYVAEPLPPFERHEAKFLTIREYLTRTMPSKLYASVSFFQDSGDKVLSEGVLPRQQWSGKPGLPL